MVGFMQIFTAPAQPHATDKAVFTALFTLWLFYSRRRCDKHSEDIVFQAKAVLYFSKNDIGICAPVAVYSKNFGLSLGHFY